ncbi:MAG: type II secretion system F family protein [Candidatus Shapirobacteria bacterium]
MKKFNFIARDQKGKKVKGLVEAAASKDAVSLLRKKGLVIVGLSPYRKSWNEYLALIFQKIGLNQVTSFTRQLSTMISSGLSLIEALELLKKQFTGRMGLLIEDIQAIIEGGDTLSKALIKYEKIFGPVYIASVKAGEESGVLDKVLSRLADNLEKKKEFVGRVKSAMIYPVIVVLGMTGVVFIVVTFVLPKMMGLYSEFGTDLPVSTRILMQFSNFMSRFFWIFPLLIFGGFIAFRLLCQKKEFEQKFARFRFKVPLLGKISKMMILTEMARTLAMLVHTGVSLVEGLEIVAQSAGNSLYEEIFEQAKSRVEKGFSLAEALDGRELIPPIVPQMIGTGEETGKLDEILFKLSDYFQLEVDQLVKNLTTAIEPLIMILLGLGVGFLVFAVIMPIYNLTSQF